MSSAPIPPTTAALTTKKSKRKRASRYLPLNVPTEPYPLQAPQRKRHKAPTKETGNYPPKSPQSKYQQMLPSKAPPPSKHPDMDVDLPTEVEITLPLLPLPQILEGGSPSPPTTPTRDPTSPDNLDQSRLMALLDNVMAPPQTLETSNQTGPPTVITTSTPQRTPTIPPPNHGQQANNPPTIRDLLRENLDDLPAYHQSNQRDLLEKYTDAPMPHVQQHRPTSLFQNISADTVENWLKAAGSKVLAIPFDSNVNNPKNHEELKGRILAAVAEITLTNMARIAAPPIDEEAAKKGQVPKTFLIYSLSETHSHTLLQRQVWSSIYPSK